MKHIKFFLSCVVLILGVVGCGTMNKATISNYVNLSNYNYVTITNIMSYGNSPILMDLSVRLYDALSTTRLHVIGDREIDKLSYDEKKQLLLVHYAATQDVNESIVSINFVDYLSGRPVASFRGAFGMGMTSEQDMDIAIKNAIEQMKQYF